MHKCWITMLITVVTLIILNIPWVYFHSLVKGSTTALISNHPTSVMVGKSDSSWMKTITNDYEPSNRHILYQTTNQTITISVISLWFSGHILSYPEDLLVISTMEPGSVVRCPRLFPAQGQGDRCGSCHLARLARRGCLQVGLPCQCPWSFWETLVNKDHQILIKCAYLTRIISIMISYFTRILIKCSKITILVIMLAMNDRLMIDYW